jgi:peptidoglycan/xylan/chitin deacetylase (PgdA/CDA1 family)
MVGQRRLGMDHDLYAWSPIPARPALRWPGGAPVALWAVVYLEYWELDPPSDSYCAPGIHGTWWRHYPDYRTYSHREYGNRIGIFRVMDALARHGVRATLAVNAAAAARYPRIIELALERDWDVAAHGTHATRMVTSRLGEDQERAVITDARDAVKTATGRRPTGWISQDAGETMRTASLLDAAGFTWLADWPNDDQPYRFGEKRRLVSLPMNLEWDDVQLLWLRQLATTRYPDMVSAACERLIADGAAGGRLLGLGIRPWLLGQPYRIRYLDEALRRVTAHDGIWKATAGEIVEAYTAQP